jgi:hypothetical protein
MHQKAMALILALNGELKSAVELPYSHNGVASWRNHACAAIFSQAPASCIVA